MSFISIKFGLFLIVSILLYYIIPKKHQWKVLLVSSYVFYSFSGIENFLYILLTTISAYGAAVLIEKENNRFNRYITTEELSKEKKKYLRMKSNRIKKRLVTIALVFNFTMLSFFKFSNYFINNVLKLENINFGIIMPLGISFYIFQSMGYLIDVYRNKYPAERNIFKFALFASYFPQLVQGPIGRFNKLAPQLFSEKEYNADNLKYGIQLAMWGLFKKLIISDRIAAIVNGVFADYTSYPGIFVFLTLIFYGIQIYTDFSGGIDIARGVSEMFGIKMSINFRQPFFATSLADFWRRWHITLGTWLKDYLFYTLNLSKPLVALNKKGRKLLGAEKGKFISLSISTFIIYFIVGLWHGAGFNYIAFGIWNGTIITMSLVLEKNFSKIKDFLRIKPDSILYLIISILRTNILVSVGRYFTRAANFSIAIDMLKYTALNFNYKLLNRELFLNFGLKNLDFYVLFIAIIILLIVDLMGERNIDFRKTLDNKSFIIQYFVMLFSIAVIIFLGFYSKGYISTEFIYKQY